MKRLCGLLCIPLVVALMTLHYSHWDTDFLSFYAGAELAGTSQLYSFDAVRNLERGALRDLETDRQREKTQIHAYIRPAFYAVLLEPLRYFSFQTADVLWQVSNVLAIGVFIWLWCRNEALPVVLFLPLSISLMLGQDAPLLLMVFAAAVWLLRKNKPLPAGLLLSLCAVKFHFFVLFPLPILAKRLWRLAAGLAIGGLFLLGLSFLVNGNWVPGFLAMLQTNGKTQGITGYMFNMTGLIWVFPLHWLWFALDFAGVAIALWHFIRHMDVAEALALALVAGVLVSLHALMYDLVFLLPWITLHGRRRAFKFVVVVLIAILTILQDRLFYFGPLIVLAVVAEDLIRNSGGKLAESGMIDTGYG